MIFAVTDKARKLVMDDDQSFISDELDFLATVSVQAWREVMAVLCFVMVLLIPQTSWGIKISYWPNYAHVSSVLNRPQLLLRNSCMEANQVRTCLFIYVLPCDKLLGWLPFKDFYFETSFWNGWFGNQTIVRNSPKFWTIIILQGWVFIFILFYLRTQKNLSYSQTRWQIIKKNTLKTQQISRPQTEKSCENTKSRREQRVIF